MKLILISLMFARMAFCGAIGETHGIIRNTATTALPTSYASAGSQLITGLLGSSNICVTNLAAQNIAIAYKRDTCDANSTDDMLVAAGGGICLEGINIGSTICGRSLGTVISTGLINPIPW
jgi:hypothetical protein